MGISLEKGKETAVSTPTPKKEEKPVKPESKTREEVIGKGTNESAIKKEEKSLTPETKVREEAIKKESSPVSEKEKNQKLRSLLHAGALTAGSAKTIQINRGSMKAAKPLASFVQIHGATKIPTLFF